MAELALPEYLKPGHHFDNGPVLSDLYRLLCMVLADQRVSNLGAKYHYISELQGQFLEHELTRILISTAIALRIWYDQNDPKAFANVKTNCGKLYPDWRGRKTRHEILSLREACNKIIHAKKVQADVVRYRLPDSYMRPYLYLYGKKGGTEWRAVLSIVDFVRWSSTVLRMYG